VTAYYIYQFFGTAKYASLRAVSSSLKCTFVISLTGSNEGRYSIQKNETISSNSNYSAVAARFNIFYDT
jgi:hypothetical protein